MADNYKGQTTADGALEGHTDWTRHAPPGGIQIAGKRYGGGRFIPHEELEKASPEEIAELNRLSELAKLYSEKSTPEEVKSEGIEDPSVSSEKTTNLVDTDNVAQEMLYIIEDGKLLGGKFGSFIIKRNTEDDIFLDEKEVTLLNTMKTTRLDIVSADKKEVLSVFCTGIWPSHDTLGQLADNIQKTPLAEYTMLNNLSPKTRDLLSTPIRAVEPREVTKMSLYRLSKVKNGVWNVETELGESKILRLACDTKKKIVKFVYRVYKELEIPIELMQEVPDGFLCDDVTPTEHENEKDTQVAQDVDKLFGLNPDKSLEKDRIVRKNIDPDLDNLNTDEVVSLGKDVKDKITPELIDKIMSQLKFKKEDSIIIKNKLLKRLDSEEENQLKQKVTRTKK